MSSPTGNASEFARIDLRLELGLTGREAAWAQLNAFLVDARKVAEDYPAIRVRYSQRRRGRRRHRAAEAAAASPDRSERAGTSRRGATAIDRAHLGIAAEGALDHAFGRPREANPYTREHAPEEHDAWTAGWDAAATLIYRAPGEVRRWQRTGLAVPFLDEMAAHR